MYRERVSLRAKREHAIVRQTDANLDTQLVPLPTATSVSADVTRDEAPTGADIAPSLPDVTFAPVAAPLPVRLNKDAPLMRCGH